MKIIIHHNKTNLYEFLPVRSKIIDVIHSLKRNYPNLFDEKNLKLYKDKKFKKKIKKNEKLTNLILNLEDGLEYSTIENCNILYLKTTNQNSLWNRIKIPFKKKQYLQ